MPQPMTPAEVAAATALPADTIARLGAHLELLTTWQQRINLVGRSTLADPWRRHILDSLQLLPLLAGRPAGLVADLGSGAGFPGLVLAIAGVPDVHLVESDARKVAFLAEAARVTGTPVTLHATRAESLPPLRAAAITARALAPLPRLLPLVHRHLAASGVAVLPKGQDLDRELTDCADGWMMTPSRTSSRTDPTGTLLRLTEIRPRV